MKLFWAKSSLVAIAFVAVVLVDGNLEKVWVTGDVVATAEARIGRPLTPLSYAGVARRTTRRVIRRSAIYVAALPAGCAAVTISGAAVWQCGATHYQAEGGRYVVVYVD